MGLLRSISLVTLVLAALPVPGAQAAAPPEAAALDAKSLTKEQFAALPDGAVVTTRGGRATAGELRARQKANAVALRARTEALRKTATAQAEAAVAKVKNDQKVRLDALNVRLRADAAKVVTQGGAPPVATLPEILTLPATIEPGSYLSLGGHGFGTPAGKVVMKGLPAGDRVLGIDDWKPTQIGVTVPGDITGVKDQNVRLQVVRKDGTQSSERGIAFVAARDVLHLLPATLVKCGKDATENNCEATSGFFAVHTEDTLWETDGADCDSWKIPPLQNGWTIQDFTVTEMSNGGARVGGMQKPYPLPGATSSSWNACWTVPGTGGYSGNGAGYWGFYVIAGPKGVPYK